MPGTVCDFPTGHIRPLPVPGAPWRSMPVLCFPAKIPVHSPSALEISKDQIRVIDPEETLQFHISKVSSGLKEVLKDPVNDL
jgi:hypothetical protein